VTALTALMVEAGMVVEGATTVGAACCTKVGGSPSTGCEVD
jgi:hypothetical protein